MSLSLIRACTVLQMPPTAKAVLFAMADYADELGHCWPSIPKLCEHTCFSRRSVIDAIAWLESAKAVTADRSNGRHTSYRVTPETFSKPVQQAHRCKSRTGANPAQTSAAPALDPCSSRTTPVQQPHPNHQEPPRTTRQASTKKVADAPSLPEGVDPQTWADWLKLRKTKKAPVTETVLTNAREEAAKAGLTLTRFLELWCARGWQGLQADWLKPHERGPPAASNGRVPVNADFSAKTYDGDTDDELPSFLRDPARAAAG